MSWIDLTLNVETDMPTCGTAWHQTVEISRMGTLATVGRNTSRIVLGSHSGTHMDSPLHFIDGAIDISQMDINVMCGEASVVDLTRITGGMMVTLDDLKDVKVTERMVFKFGWYKKWKTSEYYQKFPYFSEEAVQYLIDQGVKLMALDTPSPDDGSAITDLDNDSPNHKMLLKNNVIIVEYLCNTDCLDTNKKYEICALPLKLSGSDGSPARVVIKEI